MSTTHAREVNPIDDEDGIPVFDPQNLNISFNGCGFLGIYHVGVAAGLKAYLPNMRIDKVCGASAGAIAAVCLLGDVPCDKLAHELMLASTHCRSLIGGPVNPNFQVCKRLETGMMNLLPDDIHERANGRLYVSVTSVYTGENIIIANFLNKKELVDAVIASTFIPVFSGIFPTRIRGVPVIDGGFSVNQVKFNNHTITVSPLSGDAHICPTDDIVDREKVVRLYVAQAGTNVSWENLLRLTQVLYPPKVKVMNDLMMQGFMDCARFLCEYGIMDKPVSFVTVESHLSKQKEESNPEELEASLPETLKKVVHFFLEQELGSAKEEDDQKGEPNGVMCLKKLIYNSIYMTIYYQPVIVASRLTVRTTRFLVGKLISVCLSILPKLTGSGTFDLKTKLNVFIGILIGTFGPWIGYDFQYIEPTRDKNARRVQPAKKQHDKRKKFTCDVHVHEFMRGDRNLAMRRRQSIYQRRKSMCPVRMMGGQAHKQEDTRHPPLSSMAKRRYSIDPHLEGRSLASHNTSVPEAIAETEDEDSDAEIGSEVSSNISGNSSNYFGEEEETEVLSMQVESYVDDGEMEEGQPVSMEDAIRMQFSNLEAVSHSREGSRMVSRRGSILVGSRYGSVSHSPNVSYPGSRRGSTSSIGPPLNNDENAGNSETLQHIVRMAREQESVFRSYYTDENGELVTVSMFNVDDPSNLIGHDAVADDAIELADDVKERLDLLHQLWGDGKGNRPRNSQPNRGVTEDTNSQ